MSKIKVTTIVIMSAIIAASAVGCWNYREIDRLAIVAGVAVDKNPDTDKYLLTIEIVDLKASGRETQIKSSRLESEGETVFDAVRNAVKISGKELYWSHAKIAVISQEIAKESVVQVLDWLSRDAEPRMTVDVLVSKEKTAKVLLQQQSITSEIRSLEIDEMLKTQSKVSKSPLVEIHEFVNTLAEDGISAVLPALGIVINEGQMTSELSGAAVFHRDKLVGFLDENETKDYLFIKNQIKSGLLIAMPSSTGPHAHISLEILSSRTEVKPLYENGKPSIKIAVRVEASIDEHGISEDFISKGRSAELEKIAGDTLKSDLRNTIRKVQDEFDSDIFGFGQVFKKKMPGVWKQIKGDWYMLFKRLPVDINTDIKIRSSSVLSRPLKVGD